MATGFSTCRAGRLGGAVEAGETMQRAIGERAWCSLQTGHHPAWRRAVPALARAFDAAYACYERLRCGAAGTRWLGHRWSRSVRRLQIDLTYACNLRCADCNRSVGVAPSTARLSLHAIETFLLDSHRKGYRWEHVALLGGEPTLHPEFLSIVERLRSFRRTYAQGLTIEVRSNGQGEHVEDTLAQVPDDVRIIDASIEADGHPAFFPFHRAPCDLQQNAGTDYANGCAVCHDGGSGLTPLGYYPCPIAGGIDRVFGLGLGRAEAPAPEDPMRSELAALCRYCGHFFRQDPATPRSERMTASWSRVLAGRRQVRAMPPVRCCSPR